MSKFKFYSCQKCKSVFASQTFLSKDQKSCRSCTGSTLAEIKKVARFDKKTVNKIVKLLDDGKLKEAVGLAIEEVGKSVEN